MRVNTPARKWVHEADPSSGPQTGPPDAESLPAEVEADWTACTVCDLEVCEDPAHLPRDTRQLRRARERSIRPGRPLIQSAAAFLAAAANAPTWTVPDLLPEKGSAMWNGRPRSFKSLAAEAAIVALALHRPVFGVEGWRADRALRCGWIGEEDAHNLTAVRLRWLLAGHQADPPDTLWLCARKGLSLETPSGKADIHSIITDQQLDVVAFDTARALAPSIAGDPSAGPTGRCWPIPASGPRSSSLTIQSRHATGRTSGLALSGRAVARYCPPWIARSGSSAYLTARPWLCRTATR